jgi:hypothetical protein
MRNVSKESSAWGEQMKIFITDEDGRLDSEKGALYWSATQLAMDADGVEGFEEVDLEKVACYYASLLNSVYNDEMLRE